MSLSVSRFSLSFNELMLFNQAELNIAAGTINCLTTGVLDGGTSFLKSCAGIIPIQQGEILIDQQSIQTIADEVLFKTVTYCYEEGGLVSLFSIYNNLALPLRYHKGLSENEINKRIKKVADELDILSLLPCEPHQLNDVQKRLVNLARALVIQPKLILADELQAGMSPIMRNAVIDILLKYVKENQTMVLMTTTAGDETDFADQIFHINHQKIIAG